MPRSYESNEELVESLYLRNPRVTKAMKQIDRANYCGRDVKFPYEARCSQAVGYGATIKPPHRLAMALEILDYYLKEGNSAMDVGCRSGYLTAAMAIMVGPTGKAIGVDRLEALVRLAEHNVNKHDSHLLDCDRVKFHQSNGHGCPTEAPYDAIHFDVVEGQLPARLVNRLTRNFTPGSKVCLPVGEFADELQALYWQLKPTGLLIVPIGTYIFTPPYRPKQPRPPRYEDPAGVVLVEGVTRVIYGENQMCWMVLRGGFVSFH